MGLRGRPVVGVAAVAVDFVAAVGIVFAVDAVGAGRVLAFLTKDRYLTG